MRSNTPMTTYKSFDPATEVIGQNLLAFIQNVQQENIKPLLEKHGLAQINPEAWYPLQKWLTLLSELSEESDAMFNMVAIGTAISETAVLPPEVEQLTFVQIMFGINDFYQMQHRAGDAGEIITEQINDTHIKLTVRVPYPDDLEYGTAYGFARRFLPAHASFTVYYQQDHKHHDAGGENTIIHIEW